MEKGSLIVDIEFEEWDKSDGMVVSVNNPDELSANTVGDVFLGIVLDMVERGIISLEQP